MSVQPPVRVYAALLLIVAVVSPLASAEPPRLVVLQPTGTTRNGLPVLTTHPQSEELARALARGFSGTLLRLYAMEQEYLRQVRGDSPEPAYLLLSDRQGGFPQFGFWLDGVEKRSAGWVDLHRTSGLDGRFGAMDQIFPHELMHVIVRQLAGEPRESGANQVHAVGVRTDPVVAFHEGIAEHVQIMSVDAPDALPATRALAADADLARRVKRELDAYGRDLSARVVLVPPGQLRFLLWYSSAEQALRYSGVKANLFAREPAVPPALMARSDKYAAYLYRCVMPGTPDGPPKSGGELLSTEGVVAHLFWRWATTPVLQQRYRGEPFYEMFGARAADVSPLENVYLKIFYVIHTRRPSDTAGLLRGYVAAFPDEAEVVEALVTEALLGQPLPDAPEIWLANVELKTGTSLFDQFRGLPRPHTFDVNAASRFDWLSVPGVGPEAADQLLKRAPYQTLGDVVQAPDIDAATKQRIDRMADAMTTVRRKAQQEEAALSLASIARPYLWRLGAVFGLASAAGAWLAWRVAARRWWAAILAAVVATVLVLSLSWFVTSPGWMPVVAPLVLGGVPNAMWQLTRRRSWRKAARALAGWAVATVPALLVSRSWF